MQTGVSFDGVHSFKDWGLYLKDIVLGFPEEKREFVEVPGRNGQLDLTDAHTQKPVYGSRTLEFVFDASDCDYRTWSWLTSKIANAISGGKKKITLDTDNEYFYTGRCSLNTKKTNAIIAEIVVTCICDPYKMTSTGPNSQWLWDPFSFIDGVVRDTNGLVINSPSAWQKVEVFGWDYNESLEIRSTAAMTLQYKNKEYAIQNGTNIMTQFDVVKGANELFFKGQGTVTIIQRGGML